VCIFFHKLSTTQVSLHFLLCMFYAVMYNMVATTNDRMLQDSSGAVSRGGSPGPGHGSPRLERMWFLNQWERRR
jgi:hypothetical protein